MKQPDWKRKLPLALLLALLAILILCPLLTVFAKAVITDGRLDLYRAFATIADARNVQTILNSLLLGLCVVLLSSVIALPTAFLLARTQLARRAWLDIVFMIPFMTPPYIASMGWILFMQKRGLFQQLFPFTGRWSEGFFCFGGLALVTSLHVFPFLMTMLKNAMLSIPASLEESGAVFGARPGRRLRRILAPLLTGNYAIGALLVFDEVITGFRVALGGAQEKFGVAADIVTFGKIIGAGFPVGAVAGRAEVMEKLAPTGPVYQAGTLSGNPVAMEAGYAQLTKLCEPGLYEALDAKGEKLAAGLRSAIAETGVTACVNQFGSVATLFFNEGPVTDWDSASRCDTDQFAVYFREMLDAGFLIAPSQFEALFLSVAHSDEDIERFLAAAKHALEVVAGE